MKIFKVTPIQSKKNDERWGHCKSGAIGLFIRAASEKTAQTFAEDYSHWIPSNPKNVGAEIPPSPWSDCVDYIELTPDEIEAEGFQLDGPVEVLKRIEL